MFVVYKPNSVKLHFIIDNIVGVLSVLCIYCYRAIADFECCPRSGIAISIQYQNDSECHSRYIYSTPYQSLGLHIISRAKMKRQSKYALRGGRSYADVGTNLNRFFFAILFVFEHSMPTRWNTLHMKIGPNARRNKKTTWKEWFEMKDGLAGLPQYIYIFEFLTWILITFIE